MRKYKALAKTHEFNVEVNRSKIKDTEWWSGGSRLLQILIAIFILYRAIQYAIGYDMRVSLNPVEYVHIQSWVTSIFIMAGLVLWVWILEKFRNKTIYIYRLTNELIDGPHSVYVFKGLHENPSIATINLSDLEEIK